MEAHLDVFILGQERRSLPEAVAEHVVNQDAVQSHSAPAGKVVRIQRGDVGEFLKVLQADFCSLGVESFLCASILELEK